MADFSTLIRVWYRQKGRILPWREVTDPYKIWLSEIILQQTRVDQGKSYYLKFVKNYPTVGDLANASEDEVLNLWQGLGYYSRARNMHYSAKQIHFEGNGEFPTEYKNVLALKGVGEYTAAAICSFAYELPYAVVDGNVYRVLSRYLEIDSPIDSTDGKKEFALAANELMDKNHPGEHNQAIMELGALVCSPKNPDCEVCPVKNSCGAFTHKTQLNYPIKSKKTKVTSRYFNYLVKTDGQSLIIKKRQGKGIWEGLYDFPMLESTKKTELSEIEVEELGGVSYEFDGSFKHILSHQKIFANFWIVQMKDLITVDNEEIVLIQSIEDFPLPQLLIRYVRQSRLFGAD